MLHLLPVSMLLGSISLCSLMLVAFDATRAPQNPSKGSETPTYTGLVGEWWVAAPGTVQFQVIGSGRDDKDSKQPDLWFKTPADKDVNTLFENLVLDVILHAISKGLPVTVEAKESSGDDGVAADKGYDLVRVGLGRT